MIDHVARQKMRRRYIASGVLIIAGALIPPAVAIGNAGDDVTEALSNSGRDVIEFSDAVDSRYKERIDIARVVKDDSDYERAEVVYIDRERRDDCRVVDRYSDAPRVECEKSPKPTEEAK